MANTQDPVPEPEDSGTSAIQGSAKGELVPAGTTGDKGLVNPQVPAAFWEIVQQYPGRVGGAFAPLVASLISDAFARGSADARQVEKLRDALDEEKEECGRLRVENARLDGKLSAEKGSRTLRNSLISLGMFLFFVGLKLWDEPNLGTLSVALVIAGAALVLVGWFYRPRGGGR